MLEFSFKLICFQKILAWICSGPTKKREWSRVKLGSVTPGRKPGSATPRSPKKWSRAKLVSVTPGRKPGSATPRSPKEWRRFKLGSVTPGRKPGCATPRSTKKSRNYKNSAERNSGSSARSWRSWSTGRTSTISKNRRMVIIRQHTEKFHPKEISPNSTAAPYRTNAESSNTSHATSTPNRRSLLGRNPRSSNSSGESKTPTWRNRCMGSISSSYAWSRTWGKLRRWRSIQTAAKNHESQTMSILWRME